MRSSFPCCAGLSRPTCRNPGAKTCDLGPKTLDNHLDRGLIDPLEPIFTDQWSSYAPPSFKQCPTKGIFSGRYSCAPENRDFLFRRRLAETHLGGMGRFKGCQEKMAQLDS